jgi:hypothetical protein
MKDEGRPLEAALWEEVSNCRKLLRSKAAVVNVSVKRRDNDYVKYGVERRAQANLWRSIERNLDDIKTRACRVFWEKCERNPLTVRTVSGVEGASLHSWLSCGT